MKRRWMGAALAPLALAAACGGGEGGSGGSSAASGSTTAVTTTSGTGGSGGGSATSGTTTTTSTSTTTTTTSSTSTTSTTASGGGSGGEGGGGAAGGDAAATTSSTSSGSGGAGGAAGGMGGAGGAGGAGDAGAGGGGGIVEVCADPPPSVGDGLPQVSPQPSLAGQLTEVSRIRRMGADLFFCSTNNQLVWTSSEGNMPLYSGTAVLGEHRCRTLEVDPAEGRVLMGKVGDGIAPVPLVTLFDATSPTHHLAELATHVFDPSESPEDIAVLGPDTYAVALHDRVAVLGYDGSSLNEIGELGGFANAYGLAVSGTRLYVGDASDGVVVLDVSVPASPAVVGMAPIAVGARSLKLGGGRLFASAGLDGVSVLDLADPDAPSLVSSIAMPGSAEQLAYAGGRLFVAAWQDIRVYDVRQPAAPKLVAVKTPETTLDFTRILAVDAVQESCQTRVWAGEWGSSTHLYLFAPNRTAADIRVTNQTVRFAKGETHRFFDVTNEGAETLTTTILAGGDFTVDTPTVTVAPGATEPVGVTFTSSGPGPKTATFLLSSPDDPDEPLTLVNVEAQSNYTGLGDKLNASWTFTDENPASPTNGQSFTIPALRAGAKALLLTYFAAWCEAGDKHLLDIQKIADQYAAAGLRVVAIHVPMLGNQPPDSAAHVQASIRRAGLTIPVFEDSSVPGGTFTTMLLQPGISKLGAFPLLILEKQPQGAGNPVIVYDAREHAPDALRAAIQAAL